MLPALINIAVAALILILLVWFVWVVRKFALASLERIGTRLDNFPKVVGGLRSQIIQGLQSLVRLVATVVIIFLGYLWLVFSVGQFPFSAAWGEQLSQFLVQLFWNFSNGVLAAVPGLFVVVVTILVARWGVRVINVVFQEVEQGKLSFPGLERETARTTQTLLIVAVWLFAVVAAYPFIPGSETEAFKGLSVLIGLMITLGSTGLINQVISGLSVVYSRSVRPGDYVRIGDVEGQVINVGFLATKLKTPRQEEITLPHSVLVGAATTNYSRLAGDQGMVATVSVTIGYDVPWRQVHALLLLGATRTQGVRTDPPPKVLQRELSDFYVQYHLMVHLREEKNRAEVMSELHAQIQDAFNEFGTQIMSPHFESQPERKVFVPKPQWHTAPASLPSDSDGANRKPTKPNSPL